MIWLGIVIGIVVMQLATLIVAVVTNEREEIYLPFSIFVLFPVIKLLEKIIYKIKERKRQKKLKQQQKPFYKFCLKNIEIKPTKIKMLINISIFYNLKLLLL